MSMFDIVTVPCPSCGHEEEFQSKGGECSLAVYTLDTAPEDVLDDVNRHGSTKCAECGIYFKVAPRPRYTVQAGPNQYE